MKKIEYFSTDKLYKIKNKKINKNSIFMISIITAILLVVIALICFKQSIEMKSKDGWFKYSENGDINYKIYLKDNDYYDTSYLGQGMQYVASLIKTVNVNFNYQLNFDGELDLDSKYDIIAELRITEKDDNNKLLYSKKENLISNNNIKVVDNNLVINEEVDIDYAKYNNIVNAYKRDYGLIASGNLLLTFQVNTNGQSEHLTDGLNKSNKLQISIPLSEQTINIRMNTDKIENSGVLVDNDELFIISNRVLFSASVVLLFILVANIGLIVYLYLKNYKKDVYKTKVNKILRDYDRLIVNGKVTIDEAQYITKIFPESFEEMVDAAQTLEVPIYFYEVIPNEKCFFVIVKNDTLYKYRLTKAFLEKNN